MAEFAVGRLSAGPATRRDRARADTVQEIKSTARRVLVTRGVDGFALRAIAREMGVSAPALYRYFSSREDLVGHVVADLYGELCADLEAARDAGGSGVAAVQIFAAARAFRCWATSHPAEFGLLFANTGGGLVPSGAELHASGDSPGHLAALRFGRIFSELLAQVYADSPFPVPAEEEVEPRLRGQLRGWCSELPGELPLGVTVVFLSCWIRLYGMVSMEVFGHLRFALADAEPMFEAELATMAAELGVVDHYQASLDGDEPHC